MRQGPENGPLPVVPRSLSSLAMRPCSHPWETGSLSGVFLPGQKEYLCTACHGHLGRMSFPVLTVRPSAHLCYTLCLPLFTAF